MERRHLLIANEMFQRLGVNLISRWFASLALFVSGQHRRGLYFALAAWLIFSVGIASAQYAGTYSGSYSGTVDYIVNNPFSETPVQDSGTWTLTVDQYKHVVGTLTDSLVGTYSVNDYLNDDGTFLLFFIDPTDSVSSVSLTGTITSSRAISGTAGIYFYSGNGLYSSDLGPLPFTGSLVSPPTPATVKLSGLNVAYTGNPISVTATTDPAGLSVSITYDGSSTPPTAVGSYPIVATVTSAGYTGQATGTLVISAATATVQLGALAGTYNGTAHAATATTDPPGLNVNITYTDSGGNTSSDVPVDAGSYTVTATVDDPGYTGMATGTLVISKAIATITLTDLTTVFDGNRQGVTAMTSPPGLEVDLTYGASPDEPVDAGHYTVVATINDPNYTGSTTDIFVISKAEIEVDFGNLNFTYNGKPQPATATTNPAGYSVSFTYNGSATAPTAPGSYTVVGTVDDPDYAGSSTSTLVISKGTATVTLGHLTAVYTGKPIAAAATTVPAKLPVTFTYGGSATPPTAVGIYDVVATINSPDYTGMATGTLTITPVASTATTSTASTVSATGATLSGMVNPKGSDTMVEFDYGTSTAYGSTTTIQDIGAGTANVDVTAPISGLAPATTYHYRLVSMSAGGPVNGLDRTLTTLADPGFAMNPQAPLLGASGAQVGFGVNPSGVATTVEFLYGTSADNLNEHTAPFSIGAGKAQVIVTGFLGELTPGVTYYYELQTTSAAGTFHGTVESFTTLGFDTTLVAQKGDFAVGTSGPTFASLGSAAVDGNDDVAFTATLTTGAAGITTSNDVGIFTDIGGTRQLIAQTGSPAPDASGNPSAANFATLTDPLYNNNGDVAFAGTLKVATGVVTASNATGIWASNSGTLALLAREGFTAPGIGGANFATFTAAGLSDSGGAIVAGTVSGGSPAVTAADNAGVWEGNTASSLALMLRNGESVSTSSGTKTIASFKFLPTETIVNGQTRGFAPTTGHLVANATYTGTEGFGIVKVITPTSPVAVATSGDTDPITDATFATFSSPAINDHDNVAFLATLKTAAGITTANNTGIWADDSTSTRQLIARTRSSAPDVSGNPSGAVFATLNDPVYNANEAVAFRATLKVAAATASGIWCDSTGALELVARQGSQAPGCPTGVNFLAFTELALDNVDGASQQGGVSFLATLSGTGVTAANNTAIFAVDNTGTLQLIVRTGDVLNGEIIASLAFLPAETTGNAIVSGQARSFSASTGDLVYNATFADKSQAIFNVVFP